MQGGIPKQDKPQVHSVQMCGLAAGASSPQGSPYPLGSNEKSPMPAMTQPPTTSATELMMLTAGTFLVMKNACQATSQQLAGMSALR